MAGKQSKSDQYERETYRIAVEDWEYNYSFGTDKTRHREAPYMEFFITRIRGPLVMPELPNITSVELAINGDVRLDQIDKDEDPLNSVGHIYINRKSTLLNGYFFIPQRSATALVTMLANDKIKMVELYGWPLKRRQALIISIAFTTRLKGDDE